MNTRTLVATLAAALVLTTLASVAFTDDKPKPMSEGEMWAKMQELAQPSAMHKDVLSAIAGSWTAKGKIYSSMGEMPIEGKSENTSILGGRFIESRYEGPFMGGKFQGVGIVGFDNLSQTFQQTWIMTLATSIDVMTGSWDAESKTLTWRGSAKMPDGSTFQKRTTTCFKSADTILEESFATGPDGKEKKEMEITYTRVK